MSLVIAILLLLTAIPKKQEIAQDPAAQAEETYQLLTSQLGPECKTASVASGDSSDVLSTIFAEGIHRVRRNLFLPEQDDNTSIVKAPVQKKDVTKKLPRLTGIFIDGEKRSAMLAGKIVKRGDHVGTYLVMGIGPTTVTLQSEGRIYRLELGAGK